MVWKIKFVLTYYTQLLQIDNRHWCFLMYTYLYIQLVMRTHTENCVCHVATVLEAFHVTRCQASVLMDASMDGLETNVTEVRQHLNLITIIMWLDYHTLD